MSAGRRAVVQTFDLCSSHARNAYAAVVHEAGGPVIGLDVGLRHVGVSLTDVSRMIALPHSGYRRGDTEADRRLLGGIVAKHGVQCAVVGLPKAPDGLDCKHLRDFIQLYSRAVFVGSNVHAVAFADETFSTLEAARNVSEKSKARLRRDPVRMKQAIDSNAAAVILQDALDILPKFTSDGFD